MIRKLAKIFGKVLILYAALKVCPVDAMPCDPFTIKCRQVDAALTKYALSTLEMQGTLSETGQIWAIIKAPDQHVYAVTHGEFMGIEGGQVIKIASREVVVQQEKSTVTLRLK